ncbi:diguanylate cyclase [Photobacterium damselae]|uniref:TackOD1 domain-containing metal-binding protein n=1 Tax=Photobacterium damselae TaxID=38293 RepID=UPI0025429908
MNKSLIPLYILGDLCVSDERFNVHNINYIDDIINIKHSIIVVEKDIDETLKKLNDKHLTECLIYTSAKTELSSYLSDGIFSCQQAIADWDIVREKAKLIKNTDNKLLSWLFSYPSRRLTPQLNYHLDTVYTYPILNVFYKQNEIIELESFIKSGLIESDSLIDKIRICNTCHSGHLNYIETCPNCESIDIISQHSLHCFTCGHVNNETEFKKANHLECPKCSTKLKHIGVDYDRPLEMFSCNSCHELFIESETRAKCFSCHSIQDVSSTIAKSIYTYRLTDKGEQYVRSKLDYNLPDLNLSGRVDKEYLLSLLPWLSKLSIRHQYDHIICAIKFNGIDEMNFTYGRDKADNFIYEYIDRLNTILRTTDITCQYENDVILLVFPHTSKNSMNTIMKKISRVTENINIPKISVIVGMWTLSKMAMDKSITRWLEDKIESIENDR